MKFQARDRVTEKILSQACFEQKDVLVAGKGLSLKLLERYILSVMGLHYNGHALIVQREPSLKIYFQGGGYIMVVDYTSGDPRGHQYLDNESVFDQIVVVEDRIGSMVMEMKDVLVPIMERRDSSHLILLEDLDARSIDD